MNPTEVHERVCKELDEWLPDITSGRINSISIDVRSYVKGWLVTSTGKRAERSETKRETRSHK